MSIDWEKEVSHRSDELINDLSELVSIDSSRDIEHKTSDFPLGPGPAKALQTFLHFADRDGFETKNVDNLAGRIEFGDGEEAIAILGHVDVVPEGPGWNTDPFDPVIKDGNFYARGASDDKGPSLASYYAMKIIKELKLPTSKKAQLILGTDEESEWVGINHYMEKETLPETGFSPDAEFPAINGEKGIVSFRVNFPTPEIGLVKSFNAGIRPNMVPQNAEAELDLNSIKAEELKDSLNNFLAENSEVKGNTTTENDTIKVQIIGKGAHAMEPFNGINAATYLAKFLTTLNLNDSEKVYFSFIANDLHLDFAGEHLGIANKDDVMGELTLSPNIYEYDQDQANILLNIRYPKGDNGDTLTEKINQHLPENVTAVIEGHNQLPHFIDADDPLVQDLVGAYRDHTDDQTEPFTVGGGTYGRILKHGIAFGAMFPGDENVMHQPNEYINIDKLLKATAIYADAIYRLIK
ncbi:dipeptidase PepV [Companilactobacillus bobalius]|uniref:Succinyl-diaminopimelate desuccinylase n=2 Tax=Companilactobacillus bobalius TaxID=2801451 RepID=A0A202FEL3_9LACO|nr:dipeptidase PepV [Companilactobacillus bobalius]KAE9557209.1 dipeptidase PepV [Companilactobacillus bobalius]KRK82140.1 dipeptidase PepV [Companilactobacillus bobalius DSM 19674]OVE98878.1 Succinyl-diaminopimelate desuccinylase [Companilactobacillus bobalius]GEO58052.1 dipeptidase PepV [Companilactobacillus paralimentarius]